LSLCRIPLTDQQQAGTPTAAALSGPAPLDLLWAPSLLVGSLLLNVANGTPCGLLLAIMFLLTGVVVNQVVFPGGRYELRAFLLSYGVYVLVAGLAQCYSRSVFGGPQSCVDATKFFALISEKPVHPSLYELKSQVAAALAPWLWQWVYNAFLALGLEFGPYIGVLFNSLAVGLSGSITVSTAREIFGADRWRLRRIGTLFAFCGIFWLFAAIHIRDCFLLLMNSLVLWTLVRWLCRRSLTCFLVAVAVTAASSWVVWFLRPQSVVMFGIIFFLCFLCWYCRDGLNPASLLTTLILPVLAVLGMESLQQYATTTLDYAKMTNESYESISEVSSSHDSLGLALINRQPMPIRLVMGSGRMLVDPVPIWAHVQRGMSEYHVLKTYHGVYSICITPLVLVGLMLVFGELKVRAKPIPGVFLAAYALVTLMAVVATSLETRHYGQFMPAVLLLAVMPDTRQPNNRRRLQRMALAWFTVVIMLHVAWATLKLF